MEPFPLFPAMVHWAELCCPAFLQGIKTNITEVLEPVMCLDT